MGIPHPRIHLKVFIFSVAFTLLTVGIVRFSKDPKKAAYWRKANELANGTLNITVARIPSKDELRRIWIQKKIERLSSKFAERGGKTNESLEKPNYEPMKEANTRVHIFYYPWYRNLEIDQVSRHWNDDEPTIRGEGDSFSLYNADTMSGIRLSFYPQEGFYSSKNVTIVASHMKQLKKSGIGVAVIYWKPPGFEDSPDEVLEMLLNVADENGLKIALHVSPYYNWSIEHLLGQLRIFLKAYGSHNAIYRIGRNSKQLPVFYVYDPFELGSSAWASVLSSTSANSIRNTDQDGVFIGLLADKAHRMEIKRSHFDGFYTYFAGNGYTYGSSWKNWQSLVKFARDNKLLFVPCVAPGYAEPGGGSINRPRHKGNYFEVGMRAAIDTDAPIIAITSFNAWEEGSQIEPAIPRRFGSYIYLDYKPHNPSYFLDLAGWWVKWWTERTNSSRVIID